MTADNNKLTRQATYASVTVAVILIFCKAFAWRITDSLSLLSTLVDSLLDAAASLVTLFAVRHAQRPADHDHRFGHGKSEALAALGQSTLIVGSAVWLIVEAVSRFYDPQPILKTQEGLIVMLISIVLTLVLLAFQKHVIKKTGSLAITADSIHYKSDLYINLSVMFVLLISSTYKIPLLDPIVGAGIALYILYTAWEISMESVDVLMDKELPGEIRNKVSEIACSHPKVLGYHDLRTRSAGQQHFFQLHLELDPNMSLWEAHQISDEVCMMISKQFPQADIIIHQDPPLGYKRED